MHGAESDEVLRNKCVSSASFHPASLDRLFALHGFQEKCSRSQQISHLILASTFFIGSQCSEPNVARHIIKLPSYSFQTSLRFGESLVGRLDSLMCALAMVAQEMG